jgi:hypothetical protein
MPFFAVLCLVLLFVAALGQSFWWRTPAPQWYGGAALAWGLFFLAVCVTWPTIRALL